MRRINRECIVCGKNYDYCSGCAGTDPVWKTIYCCEDCREISHILSDYHAGILPLKDAKMRLDKCDFSKLENLDSVSKEIADEILGIQKHQEVIVEESKSIKPQNFNKSNYNNKKNKNKKRK